MNWNPVDSSFIKEVAYENGNLFVKFKDGKVIKYANVPAKTHDEFMKHPSKGKYFMASIKGKFNESAVD